MAQQQDRKTGNFASSRLGDKTGARFIAMEVLLAMEDSADKPLEAFLDEALARFRVEDQRDQGLVKAIVYGVLRHRTFLDTVIEQFSRHPLQKMKPLTLAALRSGLYQLVFLDRIPSSAAINETVEALKRRKQPPWLIGFVNGLLRTITRERQNLPAPDSQKSALASHPPWLVARWQKYFGPERAVAICRANNDMPPLVLRVTTRRITADKLCAEIGAAGHGVEKGLYSEEALRIPCFQGQIEELPGFRAGYFQIQDEAAQLVTHLLSPFDQGNYLDACAGLGGKTSHLAQLLPTGAKIVAIEPDTRRRRLLEENLGRLGLLENVERCQATLQEFCRARQDKFRAILLDAPCSGLGVIRRHPEIRWARKEQDLLVNQERQLALLETAAGLLGAGGIMVYATCSTEPEENQQVVARFLAGHPEFALSGAKDFLSERAAGLVDGDGFLRTTPDQGLDGFFGARLLKN